MVLKSLAYTGLAIGVTNRLVNSRNKKYGGKKKMAYGRRYGKRKSIRYGSKRYNKRYSKRRTFSVRKYKKRGNLFVRR